MPQNHDLNGWNSSFSIRMVIIWGLFIENQTLMAIIANVAFTLEILAGSSPPPQFFFAIFRYLRGITNPSQVELCISDF